jgi:ribosomal protein L4
MADYMINKKERQLGLQHALSLKIQKKEFFIIENLQFENSTVKEFFHFKKIHNIDSNSVLLIDNEKNQMVLKAIGNIHEANFLPIIGINVLSVIQNKFVICTEKALTVLQERGIL